MRIPRSCQRARIFSASGFAINLMCSCLHWKKTHMVYIFLVQVSMVGENSKDDCTYLQWAPGLATSSIYCKKRSIQDVSNSSNMHSCCLHLYTPLKSKTIQCHSIQITAVCRLQNKPSSSSPAHHILCYNC
jgi:hypothetical protein